MNMPTERSLAFFGAMRATAATSLPTALCQMANEGAKKVSSRNGGTLEIAPHTGLDFHERGFQFFAGEVPRHGRAEDQDSVALVHCLRGGCSSQVADAADGVKIEPLNAGSYAVLGVSECGSR